MMGTQKSFNPELPTTRQVIGYLQAKIIEELEGLEEGGRRITASIALARSRYHVEVAVHNETLDWFASLTLWKLGIPDAKDTAGNYQNFEADDYMSISPKSISDFGKTNKEKILEWAAQRKAMITASRKEGGAA